MKDKLENIFVYAVVGLIAFLFIAGVVIVGTLTKKHSIEVTCHTHITFWQAWWYDTNIMRCFGK